MATALKFDLVTPEKLISSDDVDMVVIPGSEGEMGVLAGHAPIISSLRPGVIRSYEGDSITKRTLVSGGFAEVTAERCTILATEAFDFDDKSKKVIEERLQVAKKSHDKASGDYEKAATEWEVTVLEQLIDALNKEQNV